MDSPRLRLLFAIGLLAACARGRAERDASLPDDMPTALEMRKAGKESEALARRAESLATEGRWDTAEATLQHALTAAERSGPVEASRQASRLSLFYRDRGRLDRAEEHARLALRLAEQGLGARHLETADRMSELALVLQAERRFGEAETYHRRALSVREKRLGKSHPEVVRARHRLALFLTASGDDSGAEKAYRRAIEAGRGSGSEVLVPILEDYASLLKRLGRGSEAEAAVRRAADLRDSK